MVTMDVSQTLLLPEACVLLSMQQKLAGGSTQIK